MNIRIGNHYDIHRLVSDRPKSGDFYVQALEV
jgi:hypothetical protein